MTSIARAIHFTCSNARQSNVRSFRTPYWPVTIPDPSGGALEGLTGRYDSCSKEYGCEHQPENQLYSGQMIIRPQKAIMRTANSICRIRSFTAYLMFCLFRLLIACSCEAWKVPLRYRQMLLITGAKITGVRLMMHSPSWPDITTMTGLFDAI